MPDSTNKTVYRYPGVTPFSTDQESIFFGRTQDIENLYRMIRRESLVVLSGKSGLGKSSLLNAGIIPRFQKEEEYHPVLVRFYAYSDSTTDTPLSRVKAALSQGLTENTPLKRLMPEEDSLWYHAKNRQMVKGGRPLLIFDQFEELFSYTEAEIRELMHDLLELRYTGLPKRLYQLLDGVAIENKLTEEQEDLLESPMEARLLFAIRSDRLHLLQGLANYLHFSINQTYELKALLPKDAEEAIVAPAAKPSDAVTPFVTPPFVYHPDALKHLLAFLSEDNNDNRVEGILLQMLCEHYERTLVQEKGYTELTSAHIGDPEKVIRDYYLHKMAALPEPERKLASRLIEEGLVSAGQGIRLSLHEDQIHTDYNISGILLGKLVDSRLLRSEPFQRGGYTYELSHDRLIPVVLEARQASRDAKAREEYQRQKAALEKAQVNADNERKLKEDAIASERKAIANARKARTWSYVAGGVALLSIGISFFAWGQYKEAEAKAAEVVSLSLQESEKLILEMDYEGAVEKIKSLIPLGVSEEKVGSALLEPVFWYAETGELERARGLLDTAYLLSGRRLVMGGVLSRGNLRSALQALDVSRDSFLEARYFPRMVEIPGGKFEMGDDNGFPYENPAHIVEISTFRMAKTETTWWQYGLYVAARGGEVELPEVPGWGKSGDNPVVNVSWYDAIEYANWLSDRRGVARAYPKTGRNVSWNDPRKPGYRLPTEAEWEYAARGGKQQKYAGTDTTDALVNYAWYAYNSGSRTHGVGKKRANSFGLYDLSGNVLEWCWDRYAGGYYESCKEKGEVVNPLGPEKDWYRVFRGGGFSLRAENCRSAFRYYYYPHNRNVIVGFRLVFVPQ